MLFALFYFQYFKTALSKRETRVAGIIGLLKVSKTCCIISDIVNSLDLLQTCKQCSMDSIVGSKYLKILLHFVIFRKCSQVILV